jgi:hypothetical protein
LPSLKLEDLVNKALWVVQVVLAGLFVFAGGFKLTLPVDSLAKETGMPGWFILFISVAELLGGLGLILPSLFRIQPWLTPLAAALLVVIMLGAVIVSLPMGVTAALMPLVVALLLAFVAYGRWKVAPIAPRGSAMTVSRVTR